MTGIYSLIHCYVAADLQAIDKRVSYLVGSAWATSTLTTRNSQWGIFIEFCSSTGLVPIPAEVQTVLRFLAHISVNRKYSTVNNYLSAINSLHKYYGHEVNFREYFVIKMCLSGLKYDLGTHVNSKIPLTPRQLTDIYYLLDWSDPNVLVCWTAVIFSFRTLLRKGNIVPDTSGGGPHVLQRSQIHFTESGCTVVIVSTKTLRFRDRVLRIPLCNVRNNIFDVVSMLRYHFQTYPSSMESPLFLIMKGSCLVPLTYYELLKFIKHCVSLIGLMPSDAGLHSLRRSGATFLHQIGVPLEDIRNLGDWKSLAVLLYISSPFERKLHIEQGVSQYLGEFR